MSNAKRYNGGFQSTRKKEKKKKKKKPKIDNLLTTASKAKMSSSAMRAEAEEGSNSKEKRARVPESTDASKPERKTIESANKSSGDHASSQGKSSYDHGHRMNLCTKVRACKNLADCGGIFNKISASNLIALALNDKEDDHRR